MLRILLSREQELDLLQILLAAALWSQAESVDRHAIKMTLRVGSNGQDKR